jgi:hypothetical protein
MPKTSSSEIYTIINALLDAKKPSQIYDFLERYKAKLMFSFSYAEGNASRATLDELNHLIDALRHTQDIWAKDGPYQPKLFDEEDSTWI